MGRATVTELITLTLTVAVICVLVALIWSRVRARRRQAQRRQAQRRRSPLQYEALEGRIVPSITFDFPVPSLEPGPSLEPERVILGASAPNAVQPGQEFTARFVAYVQASEQDIEKLLASLSPRAVSYLGLKSCRWQVGTQVKVRLQGTHLHITPTEETIIWEGNYQLLEFDVKIADDASETVTVLKFDVLISEIVVARLRLDLDITRQLPQPRISSVTSEPAHTAFASYASQDRPRVLDRVSEIERNGIDVFLDCLSLHPGEEWKPRLEQEIRNRELFLLFWSAHAKNSDWVTWEWKTALQQKGLTGVDPHPLDPVSVAGPPEELSSLHFGDPYMLVREAYEANKPCLNCGKPLRSNRARQCFDCGADWHEKAE